MTASMEATPYSLLMRATGGDDNAWKCVTDLYRPLISGWLRRNGVSPRDMDDLTQDVLLTLVKHLSSFRPNGRTGAFRCWLRTITVNRIRDFYKTRRWESSSPGDGTVLEMVQKLEDPNSDLSRQWDQEHDSYVLRCLLDLMGLEFEPITLRAFRRLALDEHPAEQVARELGMTIGAVYAAKSRVLKRIREEGAGLID